MNKNKKNRFRPNIRSVVTGTSLCMLVSGHAWADDVPTSSISFGFKPSAYVFKEIPASSHSADPADLLAEAINLQARSIKPEEYNAAFSRFEEAAKLGNADAQFYAALMILESEHINRNEDDAITLLAQASDQGHVQAQYALDYMLNNNSGIGC